MICEIEFNNEDYSNFTVYGEFSPFTDDNVLGKIYNKGDIDKNRIIFHETVESPFYDGEIIVFLNNIIRNLNLMDIKLFNNMNLID